MDPKFHLNQNCYAYTSSHHTENIRKYLCNSHHTLQQYQPKYTEFWPIFKFQFPVGGALASIRHFPCWVKFYQRSVS